MRSAYEVVKAHYDANDRHDIEGMLADITPTTQWTEMAGFPCAGTYHGREAIVKNVFMALGVQFDDYSFKLEQLLDAGDHAVGIGDYTARHKQTGKAMTARVVHVWRVDGGKVTHFEQFTDTLLVARSMR
jgi:uncharacterized protein